MRRCTRTNSIAVSVLVNREQCAVGQRLVSFGIKGRDRQAPRIGRDLTGLQHLWIKQLLYHGEYLIY